jgi:hypothetical protein
MHPSIHLWPVSMHLYFYTDAIHQAVRRLLLLLLLLLLVVVLMHANPEQGTFTKFT